MDSKAAEVEYKDNKIDDPSVQQEGPDTINIEAGESGINAGDLESALEKAKKLETALDTLDETADLNELYTLIADLSETVYESGVFQSATGVWNKMPASVQKAMLGKGLVGVAINNTPVGQPVVGAFRGLAQTGMLETPEGVDPTSFTQDALKTLKMLKWVLLIGAVVQPELAPLQALIPLVEKVLVKYDQLTGFVRARIEQISEETRGQAADTLGEDIINLDDHRPPATRTSLPAAESRKAA